MSGVITALAQEVQQVIKLVCGPSNCTHVQFSGDSFSSWAVHCKFHAGIDERSPRDPYMADC